MYVWGVPREIQIASLGLYLVYHWDDRANGYALIWMDEDMGMVRKVIYEQEIQADEEQLGDLDDHSF